MRMFYTWGDLQYYNFQGIKVAYFTAVSTPLERSSMPLPMWSCFLREESCLRKLSLQKKWQLSLQLLLLCSMGRGGDKKKHILFLLSFFRLERNPIQCDKKHTATYKLYRQRPNSIPTGPFSILEPHNPSIGTSEQHGICRSTDL